ncbi:MAG TPA: BRO family protein [Mobilitalea sp.]|nr:BRO family protein [Mobilitalea sp.]
MKIVGTISFGGHILSVYGSLDTPEFLAAEIAKVLDYSPGNTSHMLDVVESDEKILKSVNMEDISYQTPSRHPNTRKTQTTWFVTELGLYNLLSQSRKPIARGWRRIVHEELIEMRKNKDLNITEQFDIWDEKYSDLYFDEETGVLMQSVTVPGGDVIQMSYEMEER